MIHLPPYNIFPLGDAALTLDFGSIMNQEINQHVVSIFHHLKKLNHPGIIDIIPAYSSITLVYKVAVFINSTGSAFQNASEFLTTSLKYLVPHVEETRDLYVPVCYDQEFGPDLQPLAVEKEMSVASFINIHTEKWYRVYMIGFLPGFPYLGEVDDRIAAPRKKIPASLIAAGSVGIAGNQTGIYPLHSPGGWQIIGRTPLKIFDSSNENPVLFSIGDRIKFYSISRDEFEHY